MHPRHPSPPQFHGGRAEPEREKTVVGDGLAAALEVTEDEGTRLVPGALFDLPGPVSPRCRARRAARPPELPL